jgi:putative ABC transport system substrate-binding protein
LKKTWIILFGILLISMLALAGCGSSNEESSDGSTPGDGGESGGENGKEKVTIGITQIVEHPSLDAAREGFIAALEDGGYVEGENLTIDYQNAQNDMTTNTTIANKFVADEVDMILGISTPSAQAVVNETQEIPILFTAVTDPVGAKLVDNFENPGGNVTGTSDTHPDAISNTMKTILRFFPDAKNVGVIYNSGEQNSVANVEKAEQAMAEVGLNPVKASISTSAEVKEAAQSLIGRIDVIYIPKDNTVVSALESVIDVANQQDIPLFVGEGDSVARGGFAGFGFSYETLGYTTGEKAIEILEGKTPSEVAVSYPEDLKLVINVEAAKNQGIELTDEMKKDAKLVGK